jgi:thiol-disulfide isomerase/thioredoxin
VNFWATWCPPCRAEIPAIVRLYEEEHTGDNFEILGVAIASQSNAEVIRAFMGEFNMNFPILIDAESQVVGLYHVLPIPTSFFVDEEGIIRDIRAGVVDEETMRKWLVREAPLSSVP